MAAYLIVSEYPIWFMSFGSGRAHPFVNQAINSDFIYIPLWFSVANCVREVKGTMEKELKAHITGDLT